jgi:uncharacterized protein (TIGR02246 family)
MGRRKIALAAVLVLTVSAQAAWASCKPDARAAQQIATLNQAFIDALLKMDNSAVMALRADDGVDLLPGAAPIIGKPSITQFLNDATKNLKGYRVTTQEVEHHDLQICGDWASEWGNTHQIVQPPEGKPPIEIFGKMALILHKEKDGNWRIKQEMWKASPK